jgi:putative peptidoglycan lipid II flippase
MSSSIPSAVSWLYFAERIFQLPLGFVAAAIGVVLLPAVAKHLAEGDTRSAREAESRALEFALLVTLPAAIALAVLAKPIVSILYERGAFTAVDANAVATLLRALAFGLPAFVLVKVLLPAFLAREDMKGPLIAALTGVIVNVVVALSLLPTMGPVAAAIGVSASAVANAGLLYIQLLRRGRFRLDKPARQRLPRILAVCVLTGGAIWLLGEGFRPWMKGHQPDVVRLMALAALCSLTLAAHLVAIHILRAADMGQIKAALRNR